MNSIGVKIRELRKALGYSQQELATKLGYKSRSSINKIEAGINDISQSKIEFFAKALECSFTYLMGEIKCSRCGCSADPALIVCGGCCAQHKKLDKEIEFERIDNPA